MTAVEAKGGGAERVEKAERAASWIVGIALLALAAYIVVSSAFSLFTHSHPEATTLGIGIALASSIPHAFPRRIKEANRAANRQQGARFGWVVQYGVCLYVVDILGWRRRNLPAWMAWADAVAALGFVWFVVHEGLEAISEARESDAHEEETPQERRD